MNRAERRRAAKEVGKKGKSLADTKPPIPKNLEDQLTGHIQRWETEEVQVVPDNTDTVPEKAEVVPENKTEEEVGIMSERKKLKPISITLQGEFGTYAVENKVVTVKLDTLEMGLDKEKVQELIEELQEVQSQL